ncbi:MAG: peptide deformylase [Bacteroidetes bacterium]|nr:peptide deformylase [Bacteroidota bacterium]
MILPITVYGDPVLRKRTENISPDYPGLAKLIADMYETMYNANGIGIAAPQVGKSARVFVVDGRPIKDDDKKDDSLKTFKKVFINPEILEEDGDDWKFEEGCLSIPGIRDEVSRPAQIKLKYQDENFNEFIEIFEGLPARIIQHEYDHLEGILFTDHLSAFKKSLIKNKLAGMAVGKVSADYPIKSPPPKRRK